jgi:predicted hotdog family 3-hydroxylacyl-ACP dehydratase
MTTTMGATAAPATLARAGISLRIPHSGTMCLLDGLVHWTPSDIHCVANNHTHTDNPLRSASGLLAPCAIEYAAQAMALHGSLVAPPGTSPSPGYIASVRNVRFTVQRLDTVVGALQIRATRLAGGANEVMYAFSVNDSAGMALAEGRAAVVLDSPLPMPSSPSSESTP